MNRAEGMSGDQIAEENGRRERGEPTPDGNGFVNAFGSTLREAPGEPEHPTGGDHPNNQTPLESEDPITHEGRLSAEAGYGYGE